MLGYWCKKNQIYFAGHVRDRPLLVIRIHVDRSEPDAPSTLSFDRRHFINEGQDTLNLRKVKV